MLCCSTSNKKQQQKQLTFHKLQPTTATATKPRVVQKDRVVQELPLYLLYHSPLCIHASMCVCVCRDMHAVARVFMPVQFFSCHRKRNKLWQTTDVTNTNVTTKQQQCEMRKTQICLGACATILNLIFFFSFF